MREQVMQRERCLFTLQGINFCFAPGSRRKVTDGERVRPGGSVPQEPGGAEATAHGADGQEQDTTPGLSDLRTQRLSERNVQGWCENQDSLGVGIWGILLFCHRSNRTATVTGTDPDEGTGA